MLCSNSCLTIPVILFLLFAGAAMLQLMGRQVEDKLRHKWLLPSRESWNLKIYILKYTDPEINRILKLDQSDITSVGVESIIALYIPPPYPYFSFKQHFSTWSCWVPWLTLSPTMKISQTPTRHGNIATYNNMRESLKVKWVLLITSVCLLLFMIMPLLCVPQ